MQSFSKMLSSVVEFYNEINPATLTGAVDVLVIQQPDDTYASSPFYVRFGKMGVLRSREKIVDILINDQPVNIHMKLSDTGEAFFLERVLEPTTESEAMDDYLSPVTKMRAASASSTLEEGADVPTQPLSSASKRRWFTESSFRRSTTIFRRCVSEPSVFVSPKSYSTLQSNDEPSGSQSASCAESAPLYQEIGQENLQQDKEEGAALDSALGDTWKRYPKEKRVETAPSGWRFWPLGGLLRASVKKNTDQQDGVYLQDLEAMSPTAAERYVIDIATINNLACDAEADDMGPMSPRSVEDAGYTSHPGSDGGFEHIRPLPDVAIAVCNSPAEKVSLQYFQRHQISHEELTKHPFILQLPNLIIRIGDKLYGRDAGLCQIVSMALFNRPVSAEGFEGVPFNTATRPPHTSWRRRTASGCFKKIGDQKSSDPTSGMSIERSALSDSELDDPSIRENRRQGGPSRNRFRQTRCLSSDQLKSLPLVQGSNKVRFSVTTKYQGTCYCECQIFLWKWDDKLVISDIDGTITRSDVLGHILPMVGAQWTQNGVAELFNHITSNGYRIVYLSARAIGQSQWTKDYLRWIKQDKFGLPQGPILLSPTSVMMALHREVIEKKPEIFKIGCLMEIRNLFPDSVNPFYAGLGNRHNDVIAYTAVDIPRQRIFCINSSGTVESAVNISSLTYRHLTELVDHFFPPLNRANVEKVLQSNYYEPMTYSLYNYWKPTLPELSDEDLNKFQQANDNSKQPAC